MGVRNFLIEGVSCSGKTSVGRELARRGYHVVHGDDELAYWGDPVTGEAQSSTAYEHWIWDLEKVRALVADRSHPTTFLCGGSRNAHRFLDRLDGVFVLEIDRETLDRRLAERPDDEWGGSARDGAAAARWEHAAGTGFPGRATVIDGTQPIARVVDAILQYT